MKLSNKLMLIGVGCVCLSTIITLTIAAWQANSFESFVQTELREATISDLQHIAQSAYNTVKSQNESIREHVNHNLAVAKRVFSDTGRISFADQCSWNAANQFTKIKSNLSLPKMSVGSYALSGNSDPNKKTPVVDEATSLVGGVATVFQRVSENGDMLRVATNVIGKTGKRAIGTYIPVVNPEGKPNPVVASLLSGSGDTKGQYVISKDGAQDGVNVWDAKDADEKYPV